MRSPRVVALAAIGVLAVASIHAQVAGSVTGSVVDASGAAVPDAEVALQLPGSGANLFTSKSSGAGDFTILTVPPNTYDLVVTAKGFLRTVRSGLKVDADRATSVPPIKLDVATMTQTVEVSEAAQSVETSNAEVSTTIARTQIQNLPTLNRSPLGFVQTQAGINNARGATTVDGQRSTYVNVTLDGINIQDNFIRTNDVDFLPNLLLLDQVAEVTVTQSNASSSAFGGSSQISFVTPSGGNQFHGNAYWSNRNNYFAANTWFNNAQGVKNPFLNQNQLGGSLGGHIIKNKLFFYSNYEAFRLRQQTTANTTLLTSDARNGIFTYRDTAGNVQKVNILQAMGVSADPTMAAILAKVPTPDHVNNFLRGDSTSALLRNTAGYSFLQRNNRTRDNVTNKVDYIMSPKNSLTVSYIYNRDLLDRPDADVTYDLVPTVTNNDHTKLLSTAWRMNPKSTLTNEVRFGFNFAPALFPATQALPAYFVSGTSYTNPVNSFRSQGRYTDTYNWADNAAWVHGAHSITFGFQAQSVRIEQFNDAGNVPSYGVGIGTGNQGLVASQLPGISATDLSAANTLLSTLAGYVTSASQTFNVTSRTSGYVNGASNVRHDRYDNYAAYVQDGWKLNRRLTATLGLRWDYYTPVDERDALALLPVLQNSNVIQTVLSPSTVLDFAGSAVGRPWYNPDKRQFAPNVGLAWDPTGEAKWVIRGGYSISYVNDSIVRAADNAQSTNAGLSSGATLSGLSGRLAGGVPTLPTPAYKVPRTLADNYALNSQAAVAVPNPGLVTPYVQQWNVGVQRAIKGWVVDARYVGNHGTKEIRGIDYNQVLINAILPDFQKAQNNGLLAQKTNGTFNPSFNANIPGSQPLPFFAQLPSGGLLTNATIVNLIQTGQVGELANTYQINGLNGPVSFYTNPNVLGANVLTNYSNSDYNALQIDVQHRFSHGLQFQANYVFSRLLSDAQGNQQTNFEPFLDINNAKLERSRPTDYDLTHVFKANGLYELPFGKGKHFNPGNRVLSQIVGGWNVSGIFTKQSGSPFSVLSGRGTLNRAARSGNNTVNTTLTGGQLQDLFHVIMTGSGPTYVPSSVKGTDGRAVAPDGAPPFNGQVFFQPVAGGLGALQRAYLSGPWVWDMDAKISKVFAIKEHQSLEFRMDATNIFNHPTWFVGDQTVTSTTFGNITSTYYGRRVAQFALYYRF